MSPLERSLATSVSWLLPSLLVALPLLALDVTGQDLLAATTLHLSAVVLGLYSLSLVLARRADEPMFTSLRTGSRRFATAATLTALVTGYAALVTLATSAALRFDPSLQFLQLLSALDIAWVVTATVIGVRWLAGDGAAAAAGAIMSAVCVWSIWRYLNEVGFGPEGEWIVSGEALNRLVLLIDTMAAVVALGVVVAGIRRQTTLQPSPQS